MRQDPDNAMWSVVMFDLPVLTKPQRRAATTFRHMLLDLGYLRAQYSVYVRYTPTANGGIPAVRAIQANLPPGGEVRVVHVTDRQWAKALRFCVAEEVEVESAPEQLTIF